MSVIAKLIDETIDEVNELTSPDRRIAKLSETVIVGQGSTLDSLGVVNFLTALEEKVAVSTGRSVSLLNEDTLTNPDGPLRTIAMIERYIADQIAS
jgi:hypothetical protein